MNHKDYLAKIGRKGGRAKSPAKTEAVIANLRKAWDSGKLCKRCGVGHLGAGNRSGICRACLRAPKASQKVFTSSQHDFS